MFRAFAIFTAFNFLVGNAYILFHYIDVEVNLYNPKVSEYLLNRFK